MGKLTIDKVFQIKVICPPLEMFYLFHIDNLLQKSLFYSILSYRRLKHNT